MATAAAVREDGRGLASWPAGDTARQRKVTATRTHVQDEPETRPQGQHGLLQPCSIEHTATNRAHGQEGRLVARQGHGAHGRHGHGTAVPRTRPAMVLLTGKER